MKSRKGVHTSFHREKECQERGATVKEKLEGKEHEKKTFLIRIGKKVCGKLSKKSKSKEKGNDRGGEVRDQKPTFVKGIEKARIKGKFFWKLCYVF